MTQQTIFWPTAEKFRLHKDAEGVTPAGYYYASNSFATSEHGGTHLDAPGALRAGTAERRPDPAASASSARLSSSTSRQQSEGSADYQVTVNDLGTPRRSRGR